MRSEKLVHSDFDSDSRAHNDSPYEKTNPANTATVGNVICRSTLRQGKLSVSRCRTDCLHLPTR